MDELIKKKLARNWFKTLQEVICQEIEELEGKKNILVICLTLNLKQMDQNQ